MSRLTDLLRRLEKQYPALAQELGREYERLSSRRSFGLNFERHVPESVELPGRTIRRGDKVRFRAPRGESDKGLDDRLWLVTRLTGKGAERTAHLVEYQAGGEPETTTRLVEDLVVVAEFRDPIYPGLRSTGKVERGGDKPYHTVINGENYHALEALLFAYEGQVDCIYIDPPYNTRDKDWKYNNDYVDSDDAYRHSKWLAMMERRLKLAKRLLNPADAVLIVTIDEKEYLRLGLLLEQLFPEARIQMVTIVIQGAGSIRAGELSRSEEYAFFCFFGKARPVAWVDDMLSDKPSTARDKVRWESLLRSGTHSERWERPNLFYPIFVNRETGGIHSVGESKDASAPKDSWAVPSGTFAVWPTKSNGTEGNWRVSPAAIRPLLEGGFVRAGQCNEETGTGTFWYLGRLARKNISDGSFVVTGRDEKGALLVEVSESVSKRFPPRTVWTRARHHAGWHGTNLLGSLLPGRRFPFPKALYAVEDCIRVATGKKQEAVIVDFFSGSGTTAHAVMRLNRQDGGQRRSIMVTNNEVSAEEEKALCEKGLRPGDSEWEALGICEYITKPRIKAAITGKTPDGKPIKGDYKFTDAFPMAEGFEENAEFFDLTYEDPERVQYDLAFSAIAPLLWLRAGSKGRRIDCWTDTFDIADTYAVLFDVDAAGSFVEQVKDAAGLRIAYIVTDDERQFQLIARELPDTIQSVRLYESYLGTFRINLGDS